MRAESNPRSPNRRASRASVPFVEAALADGPKTFEGLMAASCEPDGREVVLALDALRSDGRAR